MTKWVRKTKVAARYDCSTRTIDRRLHDPDPARRLPPPRIRDGATPMWDEADLDAYDARLIALGVPPPRLPGAKRETEPQT